MNTDTPETDEFRRADCYDVESALEFARRLEQERDKYAGLLCDAMQWVYLLDDADERPSDARTEMIRAFEALELTPANGSC